MRLRVWALVRIAVFWGFLGCAGCVGAVFSSATDVALLSTECLPSLHSYLHDHSYLGAAELPGGDAAQAWRTNRISAPPRHRLTPMAKLSLGAA